MSCNQVNRDSLRTILLPVLSLVLFVSGCRLSPARKSDRIELGSIESPVILKGDATTAYRDPTAVYHNGTFYLYYTYMLHEKGRTYWSIGLSKSRDLVHWSRPKRLTPKDPSLNFCAPGNVIRYKDQWIMCFQTYPTPQGQKYGNKDARVWIAKSDDLQSWSEPEILMVKGQNVPVEKMGRLIDPYLVEDKDQPGKWWCFFDDNAANISWSYDLENWTYFNRIEAGENVCVLVDGDEYLMFHSPRNGIGLKRSKDMKKWYDIGGVTTKQDTGQITLGQKNWPWAQGRLSAAFVLDLKDDPAVGKYIMFFHGSGPEDESVYFDTYCSLGIAWSDDLLHWDWPGKKTVSTKAVHVDAPFRMSPIILPDFPDRTFDISDYGAVPEPNKKNTNAFAAAIADCAEAGGGRVRVPAGTWLTGPIHLKSNVNLHLERDAVVRFSTNFEDYLPPVFTRYEGIECYNYSPLIYANGCTNIAITGPGRLDGQGKAWWRLRRKQDDVVRRLHDMTRGIAVTDRIFASEQAPLRPSFIQTVNCRNVLIEGVTVGSGPMWTIHPLYCENVIVRGVTFITRGPNNDGVDPDSSRNVLIENCNFDTSDDAIGIKSGRDEDGWRVGRPCENIVIRNCRFGLGSKCDGVVSIGSEMSGDVRNVFIHHCSFEGTDRGIRIKSRPGRGGVVENIWIEDINIGSIRGEPILLNMQYESGIEPFLKKLPAFRNVHIKNVTCRHAEKAGQIRGLSEQFVEDVVFENYSVGAEEGFSCANARGVKLINLHIVPQKGPVILLKDTENAKIEKSDCAEGTGVFLKLEGSKTKNILLRDNDLSNADKDIVFGPEVRPDAVTPN